MLRNPIMNTSSDTYADQNVKPHFIDDIPHLFFRKLNAIRSAEFFLRNFHDFVIVNKGFHVFLQL